MNTQRYIVSAVWNDVTSVDGGVVASSKAEAIANFEERVNNVYGIKLHGGAIKAIPISTMTINRFDHALGLAQDLVEMRISGNTTSGDDTVIIAEGAVVYKLVVNVEDITLLVEMAANDPADAFLEMLSQLKRNEDYQTWERKGLLQRESFRLGEVQPLWWEHGDDEEYTYTYTWIHVLDIIDAGCQPDDKFPVRFEKKNGQIMFSKKPKVAERKRDRRLPNENVAEPLAKKQTTAHA